MICKGICFFVGLLRQLFGASSRNEEQSACSRRGLVRGCAGIFGPALQNILSWLRLPIRVRTLYVVLKQRHISRRLSGRSDSPESGMEGSFPVSGSLNSKEEERHISTCLLLTEQERNSLLNDGLKSWVRATSGTCEPEQGSNPSGRDGGGCAPTPQNTLPR